MPNPNGNPNAPRFNSETAKAAALKSLEAKRAKKEAVKAAEAVAKQDINGWIDMYQRDQLSAVTAAAAQKIAHMILDGEITDQRALVQALPALVDITRIEEGLHTTASMHATITGQTVLDRITELRAQATGPGHLVGEHVTPPAIDVQSGSGGTHKTEPTPPGGGGGGGGR